MNAIFNPNGGAGSYNILFGATVYKLRIGISQDTKTLEFYSSIEMFYPDQTYLKILKIFQEMENTGSFPEVYIQKQSEVYNFIILIKLASVSKVFLKTILPGDLVDKMPADLSAEKTTLIATAEAEIEVEGLEPFFVTYKKNKSFKLFLMTGTSTTEQPIWGVQLTSYHDGLPDLPVITG